MNEQQVEQWEQRLSGVQREKLRELQERHCRVEAVFVPGDTAKDKANYVRVSVTVDHLLLATSRTLEDIPAAFDEAYHEATSKLTLRSP